MSMLNGLPLAISWMLGLGALSAWAQLESLWEKRFDGEGLGAERDDFVVDLALDAGGSIYVTGSSQSTNGTYDFLTIKYGPTGDQLWVTRFATSAVEWESPVQIAVDGQSNVYVLGSVSPTSGTADALLVKHDPNGNVLWSVRYDGPEHTIDLPAQMLLDGSGNAYVLCSSYASDRPIMVTLKYDPAGQLSWVTNYFGPEANIQPVAITFDPAGNICASEISFDGGPTLALVKYDSQGHQLSAHEHQSNPPIGIQIQIIHSQARLS